MLRNSSCVHSKRKTQISVSSNNIFVCFDLTLINWKICELKSAGRESDNPNQNMFNISNYSYENCGKKCRNPDHGSSINRTIMANVNSSIEKEKLAAFIAKSCRNFAHILDHQVRESRSSQWTSHSLMQIYVEHSKLHRLLLPLLWRMTLNCLFLVLLTGANSTPCGNGYT